MAARSVLKLISKTCTYSLNSAPTYLSVSTNEKCKKTHRSYSQPSKKVKHQESFLQFRNISKSLENLREGRYSYDDEEYEDEEPKQFRSNSFPAATDLTIRNPAREFKEKEVAQERERNEEGNTIYELDDGSRPEGNYFEVLQYMRQMEYNKSKFLFSHLQPNNLKPYGSNENIHQRPQGFRRATRVVYPKSHSSKQQEVKRKKKVDDVHVKEFSSYRPSSTASKDKKTTENDNSSIPAASSRRRASTRLGHTGTVGYNSNFVRKSSTALLREKSKETKNVSNSTKIIDHFQKRVDEYESRRRGKMLKSESANELFIHRQKDNSEKSKRNFSFKTREICENPVVVDPCDDYVTVKLRDLQDECRREKRCKPKKISFGRLPKFVPADCPCIEDIPLKEGKPLVRLKKREVKPQERRCVQEDVCSTPRADDNYKVKPKTLRPIEAKVCPCEEREMTDLVIKRLPKKKVAEPPRICVECVGEECCPPRSDRGLKIEKKVLPKLEINNCPCTEEEPLKGVNLKRLQAKPVKEPEKICIEEICDNPRADDGMKVEKKVLPIIKSECLCLEPSPPEDVPPLRRLKKLEIPEKPRPVCEVDLCTTIRADKDLKVKSKKLPVFVPRTCPCVEEKLPEAEVKLKRLIPRNEPKEKEKICPVEICDVRADDGLVVKPKKLPQLEPGPCPCVEVEMLDVVPLKKLKPKPVKEPLKVCAKVPVCDTPRSDANLKVPRKNLPVLPPGSCPCVEPEPPIDTPPLKKLKKKPVAFKRICVEEVACDTPRADDNLKVKVKKLPKLVVADCPCIEAAPPEDVKPLRRLKKSHVPEPCRVCPKIDDCEDIPRADEDDWLYWRKVEVKSAECETKPINKRSFSTTSRRYYTTSTVPDNDVFQLKYDVGSFPFKKFTEQPQNLIIDIKPSAPLILTQKPYNLKSAKGAYPSVVTRSRSEPINCVKFVIYKSNNLGRSKSEMIKDSKEGSSLFNPFNRFISTCSTLYEFSERGKENLKDHTTPACECPVDDNYLQPKNPIIKEKEMFITPYPTDDLIDDSAKKSRKYSRTRKEEEVVQCTKQEQVVLCEEEEKDLCDIEEEARRPDTQLTWWERIVNYFKARPGCPSPEEFRKMRLKQAAEMAASKAGLCLYDPKEILNKAEKELPKVITDESIKNELKK